MLTTLAFILFLHFFLNLKKTEFAAATLICCPIILLHNEKKISFLVVKTASDGDLYLLIKNYQGPSEIILTSRKDIFFSLCKSIIGQQISVAAANSVFLKFKKRCNNKINAKTISKLTFSQLKKCGLSRMKVLGIKSLAKQILNKSFNPKLISKMNDDEAIIYLSNLRQIGRWSAEMILLFTYNRSNI